MATADGDDARMGWYGDVDVLSAKTAEADDVVCLFCAVEHDQLMYCYLFGWYTKCNLYTVPHKT